MSAPAPHRTRVTRLREGTAAGLFAILLAMLAMLAALTATSAFGQQAGSGTAADSSAAAPDDASPSLRALLEAAREEPDFLPPDEAFRLRAMARNPGDIVLQWRIEPGYYLYRGRTQVELGADAPAGTSLAALTLPPGEAIEDPYFGKVEVYRQHLAADARLTHEGAPPDVIDLAVVYQGCADAGLCYPPIQKVVSVRFDGTWVSAGMAPAGGASGAPGGAAAPFNAATDPALLSETDQFTFLLVHRGLPIVLGLFFGFGLLLAFTPCILPMIPILSSILVANNAGARKDDGIEDATATRGFLLALAYVLGSALTWAVVGAIAGLFGSNFQIAFQSPWTLGAMSVLFVVFALSMFGLFTMQIPSALQTRIAGWASEGRTRAGGGYAGAAVMGLLSALIVGACVAAPMAGAVLYLAQEGSALRGALALFAMGLGMGAPLLVLGASFGRLLPRPGAWMDLVENAVGVLLLGVALYLSAHLLPHWAAMLAWTFVAAAGAIVLGHAALKRFATPAARRTLFASAAVVGLYAFALGLGASTGARDPLYPLAGLMSAPTKPGLAFMTIKGLDGPAGFRAALARARSEGRMVMLDFRADWCVSCIEMEETTFRDPLVHTALQSGQVLLLQADVTQHDAEDRALMRHLDILGPPAILFFGPDGSERRRYRTVGYKTAVQFAELVTGATARAG